MSPATAAPRRRPAPLLLVAVLVCVLGLAGCSGDSAGNGGQPGGADASGAREVDPDAFLDRVLGAFEQYESAQIEVSTSGVQGGVTVTGTVDYSGEQPAVELVVGEQGRGALRVRTVGNQVYVSVPQVTEGKFVALGSGAVPGLDRLTGGGLDPRATLRQTADAVTRVEDRGREDRDGQTLRHYRMYVDTSRLRDQEGTGEGDQGGGGEAQDDTPTPGGQGGVIPGGPGPGAAAPEQLVYDLYTDEKDRLVRSSVDLGDQGRTVVELSEWDEGLRVTKPSGKQLAEGNLRQLLQGLRRKQGSSPAPSPSG